MSAQACLTFLALFESHYLRLRSTFEPLKILSQDADNVICLGYYPDYRQVNVNQRLSETQYGLQMSLSRPQVN